MITSGDLFYGDGCGHFQDKSTPMTHDTKVHWFAENENGVTHMLWPSHSNLNIYAYFGVSTYFKLAQIAYLKD